MQVKVTTKMKNHGLRSKRKPVVVITLTIEPRGSGNRRHAEALAAAFRDDPIMGQHLSKVVCGSSSVHVHLPPTFAAWGALNERLAQAREAKDVAGQMLLPIALA